MPTPARTSRRGFATILALWALAIVVLVFAALQAITFHQAASGREALARVRAHWAARAGVEAQIAALTSATLTPDPGSVNAVYDELIAVARADLGDTSYLVQHSDGVQILDGPLDAHTRLNVSTLTIDDLMLLDSMEETVAQSILNWINGASTTNPIGADDSSYTGLRYPYQPRLAPVRTLRELVLVQGVDPVLLLGQDQNDDSLPDPGLSDTPDINLGWSLYLTAVSEGESYAATGQPRINLKTASTADIAARLSITQSQAQTIQQIATQTQQITLAEFVRSTLRQLTPTQLGGNQQPPQNLTDDQIKTMLQEWTVDEALLSAPRRGKININTAPREVLERHAALVDDPALLDSLIARRDALLATGGVKTMLDLVDDQTIDRNRVADWMEWMDVSSQVFVVTSRGRDKATGFEVEIVALLDRSSIPVVIKDLFVR